MNRRSLLVSAGLLPLVVACASVDTQQTTTINAVVETVDPVTRQILLRGDGGSQAGALVTMVVSPLVQRLNEIHSGDHVIATYYQALAAQVVNVTSPDNPPFAGVAVGRNDTAARPGGEVTRVRQGRVTITAIDPANGTVSFVGPGGIVRTVAPKNPDVQAFVRRLRVGEQVDIVYEEALAISIVPAA
jgi:type IV pilus biogenesis protein CpaD/CtpE